MWSKQADVRNANMTSLKSKITQRKRKNSKPALVEEPAADATDVVGAKCNQPVNNNKNKTKNKKSGKKNKGRCESGPVVGIKSKESSGANVRPDLLDNLDRKVRDTGTKNCGVIKDDVTHLSNGNVSCSEADVVLRNEQTKPTNGSQSVKRYSDSFVVFGDIKDKSSPNQLSRAQSGFFLTDTETSDFNNKSDKVERKHRRFSDLFRYGALKSYSSCDNLKAPINMIKEYEVSKEDYSDVVLREKLLNDQKGVTRKLNKPTDKHNKPVIENSKNSKSKSDTKTVTTQESSYLKRVKSKIYKQKNDGNHILPTMPNISEDVKQNKKKKGEKDSIDVTDKSGSEPRRSIPHFDFRMIRQSSNLERIRPRTFMAKKSASNAGISELVDSTANIMNMPMEKPVLSKSKSSSAINLNLLRTRRNKIMEQMKKNCETVEDEFMYIAFGMNRKFGSQNLSVNSFTTNGKSEEGK